MTTLSAQPQRVLNDAWAPEGATLLDGRKVSSWDWWSHRAVEYKNNQGQRIEPLPPVYLRPEETNLLHAPVIYGWWHPMEGAAGILRFFKVGERLFVATNGPDFDLTGQMSIGEVYFEGDKYVWSLTNGAVNIKAEVNLLPDGRLEGKVYYSTFKVVPIRAVHLAPPFRASGSLLSLLSVPDESFVKAVGAVSDGSMFLARVALGYASIPHYGQTWDLQRLSLPSSSSVAR